MRILVIFTAQVPGGGTARTIQQTVDFAGPPLTRTNVYSWALREAGITGLRADQYAVTFFYAEPDTLNV